MVLDGRGALGERFCVLGRQRVLLSAVQDLLQDCARGLVSGGPLPLRCRWAAIPDRRAALDMKASWLISRPLVELVRRTVVLVERGRAADELPKLDHATQPVALGKGPRKRAAGQAEDGVSQLLGLVAVAGVRRGGRSLAGARQREHERRLRRRRHP